MQAAAFNWQHGEVRNQNKTATDMDIILLLSLYFHFFFFCLVTACLCHNQQVGVYMCIHMDKYIPLHLSQ